MKKFSILAAFVALSLGTSLSFADTVVTKDGSKLVGKITQIDGANVVVKTDSAGEVKIKSDDVVSLATDAPMNVRQNDGTTALGAATMRAPGAIVIVTDRGPFNVNMADISQTWAADAKDPEVAKRERHWSFEAGLNIAGRTGNTEQFGASAYFRATLKSSFDTLLLYTGYDFQVTDKNRSANQGRLGADYQNNFSGRFSWYARDELGFDRIKSINLYNTVAAGFGYDIVKTKVDTLTFRAGLAHRYESYIPADEASLSTFALDFALINELKMKTWSMHNLIRYMPSVDNINKYWLYHESSIEIPLANPHWKFGVGVSNDYHKPLPSGVTENLDTTYFARLILNW